MNLAVCSRLPRTPENATWYRLVQPAHLATALSSSHTRAARSRYNPGSLFNVASQFSALYFADDPLVAQFEVGAVLGSLAPGGHIPNPRATFITMNVRIVLGDVIDLTEVVSAQVPLVTSAQELTGDWQGYHIRNSSTSVSAPTGISPTQQLGAALFRTGAEGFRAISARVPYHKTLTVFPDNLQKGSSLIFTDPAGTLMHQIRP